MSYFSADVGGTVTSTGGHDPMVTLYWGDNDGGTDPAAWDNAVDFGINNGSFSLSLSDLTQDTTYYHRSVATNSSGVSWTASTASFTTLAVNPATIINAPAEDVTALVATIGASVLATGGDDPDVTLYWGDNDGGTDVANWDHNVAFGVQTDDVSTQLVELSPETGKDIIAASRISRSLASIGIAVLRFDFTGLGSSDGDFENTNFSGNIEDIISAVNFLRDHYEAPQLLIGHSLGGTAVLNAAGDIPECKAVVSIGSPATADHLLEKFPDELKQIKRNDEVTISLGGKAFQIKRQFVEDLQSQATTNKIGKLRKALLILHSPLDKIVPIDEATRIFISAKHPKSFVTLDKADHLLSDAEDTEYVANIIEVWAARYTEHSQTSSRNIEKGEIVVGEGNHKFLREVSSDDHMWLSDEPKSFGGDNLGPDPYEQLLSSLRTCMPLKLERYGGKRNYSGGHPTGISCCNLRLPN